MKQQGTALVLGATGGVGGEVARVLVARGWRVKALNRHPAKAPHIAGVEWLGGDAMRCEDVAAAAEGASVLVHAVNPPGYRDWDRLVLPMLDNTIAAARTAGARVLLPGTIYNYGSGTAQRLSEATPQRPSSRKGEIRVQMELRLQAAAAEGVRVLIVRAGDFFGPRAANNWFSQALIAPGRPVSRIIYPGAPGAGHAWAYLPDLADTMVRLLEQEARLGAFETFHFGGHWDLDGSRMVAALRRAAHGKVKVWGFPWTLVRLCSPFRVLFREMAEMRYLWQESFELDNARLLAFLGSETHTPLDAAVAESLAGQGCVAGPEASALAGAP
jgi:nucleoside-diphosphate-sugar epimerase